MTRSQTALALQGALDRYGAPETFNSDQGSQFTAQAFTEVLTAHGVTISMDARGSWLDNVFIERFWRTVKYEEVVCYERTRPRLGGCGALSKMRVGPSEPACRSGLQTAMGCVG